VEDSIAGDKQRRVNNEMVRCDGGVMCKEERLKEDEEAVVLKSAHTSRGQGRPAVGYQGSGGCAERLTAKEVTALHVSRLSDFLPKNSLVD